jgi:hypothetical protein
MKTKLFSSILLLSTATAFAQQHEVGLTLGGLFSQNRGIPSNQVMLSAGTALQANYGYRFLGNHVAALYGEVHFLANPQRTVTSINQASTRDVATLYVTPGIRVKFAPRKALSPYVAVGGGFGDYEQSRMRLDGQPNGAPRQLARGVFDFGGGLDVRFLKFIGLRAEIRDFYTGSPAYNSGIRGGQHNVVAGGGIVLKFGGRE